MAVEWSVRLEQLTATEVTGHSLVGAIDPGLRQLHWRKQVNPAILVSACLLSVCVRHLL